MKTQASLYAGLVLAGLVLCAQAQVFSWGACPTVTTKEDFNTTEYFGKWYEILRFNRTRFETGTRCNYAEYSQGEDDTMGVKTGSLSGTDQVNSVEGYAYAPDPSQPGKLKVKFEQSWFAGDYWVLDTDYETYSMVHACTGFLFFNLQLNWLLSPARAAQVDVVDAALEKFRAVGVDTSQFMRTNQARCPDF